MKLSDLRARASSFVRSPAAILGALRCVGLVVALLYGGSYFLRKVTEHYPVGQWLFWSYARAWLGALALFVACVSSGHAVLRRIVRVTLPLSERLATSFALGVYVFFLGIFVGGLFHLYGTAFFYGFPLALVALGAKDSYRTGRRVVHHLRAARRRARPTPLWQWGLYALGFLGFVMVYVSVLTPGNVAFDSRWQHLGLAEHYAAEHGVSRFPEGYFVGTSPHVASFLYTWAFLLPKGSLFEKVMMAAHIEVMAFLVTLVGIVAVVRVLVPHSRAAASWAMRFAFPGIFLYDSSLCVGADHIAAIFAAPIFCLLVRCLPALDPRLMALLATMLAGCFLTKYTGALILIGFPVVAIFGRIILRLVAAAYHAVRKRPDIGLKLVWKGPLIAVGVGLLVLSPHLVKNAVWYGDPLYPLLAKYFTPHPWTPDSADRFYWGFIRTELWRPVEVDARSLKDALKVLWSYSFVPNDWPKFHGKWPTFGSLFTLLLLCLPFLKRTGRLWLLYGAVHMGILAWFFTHHQDRYLQTVVPWMAAGAAGVVILVFRSNIIARVAVVGVVALQVIWGADAYFIPSHAMIKSPLKAVADLANSGYRKDYDARNKAFTPYSDIGKALPDEGVKVLVHEYHPHLGIDAPSVNDYPVNQGGLSYGLLGDPSKVDETLRGYGVTHLMWVTNASRGTDTLAGDLLFQGYVTRYGVGAKAYGSFTLAEMPKEPPPVDTNDVVAAITCAKPDRGLYHLANLHVPVYGPDAHKYPKPFQATGSDEDLVKDALYVVVETKCKKTMPSSATSTFRKMTVRGSKLDLWIRR